MKRSLVLVHGAFHGSWVWEKVAIHLDRADVPWIAVDLPSAAEAGMDNATAADIEAVNNALDQLEGDEPAVLVGHSRGGLVVTEAGTHERVGQLVYVAGADLLDGQSLPDILSGGDLLSAFVHEEGAIFSADIARASGLFYNDCTGEDITWAAARLRSQDMSDVRSIPSEDAWQHRPSTYVVCTRDRVLPQEAQKVIANRLGSSTVHWDAGHHPMISQPALVGGLLIGLSIC